MPNAELLQLISNPEPRSHGVVFYSSKKKKREILFGYLKNGAERGEGLAYVCSEETPLQVKNEMRAFGLEVESLIANNQLMVSHYGSIYIVDGRVSIPIILRLISDLSQKYRFMGLKGLRACGEMGCFLKQRKMNELIHYELTLHRKLFQPPTIGICAYDIHDLEQFANTEITLALARAHDSVILVGNEDSRIIEPEGFRLQHIRETLEAGV